MKIKKTNYIFLCTALILMILNCANTGSINTSIDNIPEQYTAEQKSLPAPPEINHLFQSENSNVLTQQGIVINGVEWSAYNIDRDGAFVENPEDSDWTYQWNSIKPEFSMTQVTAGLLPANFLTNYPTGSLWEKTKDPSPDGWRVPTQDEVLSLFDTNKVTSEWIIQNNISGRRFTDRSSGESIFIPAAGRWFARIDSGERTLQKMDIGTGGYYWTATGYGDHGAVTFGFSSSDISLQINHRTITYMIRPVRALP
jgi:uncharacterized protein (TIGR02145 family)